MDETQQEQKQPQKKQADAEYINMTERERAIERLKPYRYKKGQTGNPKGRPPMSVQSICKQLKKDGYKQFGKQDVQQVYLYCMALPQTKMEQMLQDKDTPFIVRLCIRTLMGKKGFEAAEKMLDRALGKATEKLDITSGGEKIKQEPLMIEVIDSRQQVDEREDV